MPTCQHDFHILRLLLHDTADLYCVEPLWLRIKYCVPPPNKHTVRFKKIGPWKNVKESISVLKNFSLNNKVTV